MKEAAFLDKWMLHAEANGSDVRFYTNYVQTNDNSVRIFTVHDNNKNGYEKRVEREAHGKFSYKLDLPRGMTLADFAALAIAIEPMDGEEVRGAACKFHWPPPVRPSLNGGFAEN